MKVVKDEITFYNFSDFYKRADMIKYEYDLLSLEEKQIYKLYVYSHGFMKVSILDKIWEFLNEPFGSCYYLSKDMLAEHL